MGDWPRLVNLRRCARGYVTNSGAATNTTVSLYNNSSSAELLLIWQINNDSTSQAQMQWSYQQLAPFTTTFTPAAIVPGDAPPPGIISTGDLATELPFDTLLEGFQQGQYWPATFPFAVLLPGWALVGQPQGGGTGQIGANFFWEAILSKYFDRMHSALCVELELQEDSES